MDMHLDDEFAPPPDDEEGEGPVEEEEDPFAAAIGVSAPRDQVSKDKRNQSSKGYGKW